MIVGVYVSSIDYNSDKLYDYIVPPWLEEKITAGTRVVVPFGRGNKKIEAVVLECRAQSELDLKKIKPIASVTGETVSPEIIEFAAFMKEHYFCTFYEALKLLLPPGEGFKFAQKVSVNQEYDTSALDDVKRQIYDFVEEKKQAETSLIKEKFKSCEDNLDSLIKDGALVLEYFDEGTVADKTVKTVIASDDAQKANLYFLKNRKNQKLYKQIYDLLLSGGAMSVKEICYITGCKPGVLNTMEKNGLVSFFETKSIRSYYSTENIVQESDDITLNDEQTKALEGLRRLFNKNSASAALLYGVTGSGKTLVYLGLIDYIIKSGKTAILLVPEIALSPQVFYIFFRRFGRQVSLLHSKMSIGERRDEYYRINKKEVKVVVGTRMAVFANLENIGAIIIDEEQEHTYKSEQSPRYSAVEIAKYRCAKHNALLLLGSATPSLESFYNAKRGKYSYFALKERFGGTLLPKVETVDMSSELKNGNSGLISGYLEQQLKENIQNSQQSIIYLNRRGHSTYISCVECSHVIKCKNCSIPMRYHKKNNRLMCHYCGYSIENVQSCPSCGGMLMKFSGAGTQKVEEHILKIIPNARVLRMDADTTAGKKSHDDIINAFNKHKADILIGTQMVTKGLDFENVTLVGVINADAALYSDDYRASETAFSQITQVIGRAGRRSLRGRAVLQTLDTNNKLFEFCKTGDYEGFYDYEIGMRKLLIYPPFCDLAVLTISSVYEDYADNMALELDKILKRGLNNHRDVKVIILGPAKPALYRINNKYRSRIILKCVNNAKLRSFLKEVITEFDSIAKSKKAWLTADINPPSLI